MKPKILISHHLSDQRIASMDDRFDIKCLPENDHKYEQVSDIIQHFDALFVMGHRVDRAMIDRGKKLRIIANYGVGYDNINAAYAAQKGIAVTNTPNSTTAPTANFTIALLLDLLRKVALTDRWLREENIPDWDDRILWGDSVIDKTLGIIGMGRIGKAVAARASALGMHISYYSRTRYSRETERVNQWQFLPLEQLLSSSDVISIHVPMTDETSALINSDSLKLMKAGAFLVNTARGGIVDMKGLINALEEHHIAGAALDVFPEEPRIPPSLLKMDNVVLTPHNGTGTKEARRAMFDEALGNIIAFLTGNPMTSRVA
jgi:glyoxylate reductase